MILLMVGWVNFNFFAVELIELFLMIFWKIIRCCVFGRRIVFIMIYVNYFIDGMKCIKMKWIGYVWLFIN